MGLAASQARLLTITARKADCEFASMTLSHQKLALSRDMENVSNEYQNALNQTKLVYDYYGTGDSDIAVDYDLLMTPSVYNDYYPKTVTDAKNRVILNSSLAAAARAAGIPAEGLSGTPSSDVRNAFIEALAQTGVITPAKAASIESVTYANTIGLGATTNVTQGFAEVTYDELIDLITATTGDESTTDYGLVLSMDAGDTGGRAYLQSLGLGGDRMTISVYNADGTRQSLLGHMNEDSNITLKDLLSNEKQYVWTIQAPNGAATPITEAAYLQQLICGTENQEGSFTDYLMQMFGSVLGGVSSNEAAIQYAANAVYDLVYPNSNVQDIANNLISSHPEYVTGSRHDREGNDRGEDNGTFREALDEMAAGHYWKWKGTTHDTVANNAFSSVGAYVSYCGDAGNGKNKHSVSINLNTLAQVFLTAFVEYQEGIENSTYSYNRGSKGSSVLYDPEHSDFKFTIATQTEVESDEDNLYANFYDALFNQICTKGWTENAQIENVDYMTDLFKNGLAFISSIAEDGYYYQGSYSTDRAILEVSDDNAIAVAEAKYNTEKTKIENKEDTIDMKMKNLDTEISSLTTEYESTKQIVTKAIEKSFKRYEA